jgi:tetraacyldisaccharide 4'-kinase
VDLAGDEPLMLARALPNVPVLVADDRYVAGQLAETKFGATVHVLDDGFQHVALARDANLVLLDDPDLDDDVLPGGRLREPLSALGEADAILLPAESANAASRVSSLVPDAPLFVVRRGLGVPRSMSRSHGELRRYDTRVFAVAAVAQPHGFFSDLAAAGWNVTGAMAFPDHHWFTTADVAKIEESARQAGAAAILTTDKDAVRLEAHRLELPLARVPLVVSIEPPFEEWLISRVNNARARRIRT